MPRTVRPLSDAAIRAAKPRAKPFRLFDGTGLYLDVQPSGSKLWRLKYRFAGKEKRLALGASRAADGRGRSAPSPSGPPR
jgi:hypothetical protein